MVMKDVLSLSYEEIADAWRCRWTVKCPLARRCRSCCGRGGIRVSEALALPLDLVPASEAIIPHGAVFCWSTRSSSWWPASVPSAANHVVPRPGKHARLTSRAADLCRGVLSRGRWHPWWVRLRPSVPRVRRPAGRFRGHDDVRFKRIVRPLSWINHPLRGPIGKSPRRRWTASWLPRGADFALNELGP